MGPAVGQILVRPQHLEPRAEPHRPETGALREGALGEDPERGRQLDVLEPAAEEGLEPYLLEALREPDAPQLALAEGVLLDHPERGREGDLLQRAQVEALLPEALDPRGQADALQTHAGLERAVLDPPQRARESNLLYPTSLEAILDKWSPGPRSATLV